jgi:hypothetical protein
MQAVRKTLTIDHLTSGSPILASQHASTFTSLNTLSNRQRNDGAAQCPHTQTRPVCEHGDVTNRVTQSVGYTHIDQLWQQARRTNYEHKRQNVLINRCGNATGQYVTQKEAGDKIKYKIFLYGDTVNVEHEMCDYVGNKWDSNRGFEKLEAILETR